MRIPVSDVVMNGNEERYVLDVLRSGRLSQGAYVAKFESAFAAYVGADHAVACSSGSAALHLLLLALGVRPGHAVFVPALTYVATANAVRYCGAYPYLVDVHPDTWCLDPRSLSKAIVHAARRGHKPVGVLPVHLYGALADMEGIGRIAFDHGLWVAEDAAQGLGAADASGLRAGALGAGAAFSFFANKIITAGEGGMVTTNDARVASLARLYRGQCVNTAKHRYYHEFVGYNYRMTEIQAAIGLAQLEMIESKLDARRAVIDAYIRAGVHHQSPDPRTLSAPWMATTILPSHVDRNTVAASLEAQGIETRPVFVPLHDLPMYHARPLPVASYVARHGLNLPTHTALQARDTQAVIDALATALRSNTHE
jgi:perosamine synthetase